MTEPDWVPAARDRADEINYHVRLAIAAERDRIRGIAEFHHADVHSGVKTPIPFATVIDVYSLPDYDE